MLRSRLPPPPRRPVSVPAHRLLPVVFALPLLLAWLALVTPSPGQLTVNCTAVLGSSSSFYSAVSCMLPPRVVGTSTTTLTVDHPDYVTVVYTAVPISILTYEEYSLSSVSTRQLVFHDASQVVLLGDRFTSTGEVSGLTLPLVRCGQWAHTAVGSLWLPPRGLQQAAAAPRRLWKSLLKLVCLPPYVTAALVLGQERCSFSSSLVNLNTPAILPAYSSAVLMSIGNTAAHPVVDYTVDTLVDTTGAGCRYGGRLRAMATPCVHRRLSRPCYASLGGGTPGLSRHRVLRVCVGCVWVCPAVPSKPPLSCIMTWCRR
jgi:hypothetical protein